MSKNPHKPVSEEIFKWQYQRTHKDDYTADEFLAMSTHELIKVAREVYGYPLTWKQQRYAGREMVLGWILQESRYDDIEFEPIGAVDDA